ncbi:MAG: EAL domain-containing protein, partial [Lachnospiraceae bacterium]
YIGVYIVVDQDEAVETMYDKASLAIERVRGDYQQIITYYDDSDLEELIHEKNVVAEFDRAIANREFCIYLQPQVDCDGNALGAEALVRWQHPDKGLLFPGAFLGIIEKAGLIYKLDYYIWEMAAMKLAEWKKEGKGQYHISVNISAKDFYYLDLYETFTGLVKKYDIEPDKLNLEITETVIMSDVKMHMQIINRLQEYGFHIEIDDFGSGYSSLNTLKDINADVIKIDMLFLRETENQARSKTILNSIISMAKALNMPVITEGVETQNQVEFLSDMGCDMFQGYYFSKPIPVKDFEGNYLKAM